MKTPLTLLRRLAWLTAALAAAAFGAVTLLVYQAPRPPRFPPQKTPADDGVPYRDIDFTTSDHVRLAGWWCPAPRATGTVILCHGYPGSRSDVRPLIRFLHVAGYNVLTYDFRRLGASGGDISTIGLRETRDLRAAVDEAVRRSPAPVAVLGVSMGAAVAIMEAAEDARVKGVIADSAYDSLDLQTRRRVNQFIPGPLRPALGTWAAWLGSRIAGEPLANASPVKVVGAIAPRPVLLIHCGEDRVVTPQTSRDLYAAAAAPVALWILPAGGHILAHQQQAEEYERRVRVFLRKAFQDP